MSVQRWTTASAEPSENGGFVAYGDYLVLEAENAALRHDIERHIANHAADLNATQGADARPVAWRARGYAQFKTGKPGEWRYCHGADKPKLNDPECCDIEPLYAARDAAPSDGPNAWADLWYFVMDEAPMEFERIVATVSPKQWHSEAHKLMRAKYPIAPREKT